MFLGFKEGIMFVKMKKPRKKKSLASNWEGPFVFVKYLDGLVLWTSMKGGRIYVIKGKEE
jgi:hypothetical protein